MKRGKGFSGVGVLSVVLIGLMILFSGCAPQPPARKTEPSAAVVRPASLADAVNAYRRSRGLDAVPMSATLERIARAHAEDLERHHRRGTQCNMHSWTDNGNWTSCCYTPDHAQAACMWDKPAEFSAGRMAEPGYEIVAHYTDPITAEVAVETWRGSPPHHAMMANLQNWRDTRWRSMGAAMSTHYAVVWFSTEVESSP